MVARVASFMFIQCEILKGDFSTRDLFYGGLRFFKWCIDFKIQIGDTQLKKMENGSLSELCQECLSLEVKIEPPFGSNDYGTHALAHGSSNYAIWYFLVSIGSKALDPENCFVIFLEGQKIHPLKDHTKCEFFWSFL